MCRALGLPIYFRSNARARIWGLTAPRQEAHDRQIEKSLPRSKKGKRSVPRHGQSRVEPRHASIHKDGKVSVIMEKQTGP